MKLAIIIALMLITPFSFAESKWDLVLEEQGIKVYTRENPKIDFKDFKAIVTINAELKKVAQLLYDVEDHTNWMYKRTLTEIMKPLDGHSSIVYFITEAPWPISNRDAVASYVFTQDTDNHIHIKVDTLDGIKPITEDMVRVPFFKSYWDITKIDEQHTQVEFSSSSDPGGNIPTFLANSAVIDMPYYSLLNLRSMLSIKTK